MLLQMKVVVKSFAALLGGFDRFSVIGFQALHKIKVEIHVQ